MSTQCLTCGDVFVCKCDKSAQNTVESAQHSLQQLKAEIAAYTKEVMDKIDDAKERGNFAIKFIGGTA